MGISVYNAMKIEDMTSDMVVMVKDNDTGHTFGCTLMEKSDGNGLIILNEDICLNLGDFKETLDHDKYTITEVRVPCNNDRGYEVIYNRSRDLELTLDSATAVAYLVKQFDCKSMTLEFGKLTATISDVEEDEDE